MIKISVQGAKEFISGLLNARKGDAQTHEIIGAEAKMAANRMKSGAPKKSGRLARGISAESVGQMQWVVRSDYDYWRVQTFGTIRKNYPIYPRNKKALMWPGLDHPIAWVKSHPGIPGKGFVQAAVMQTTANVSNMAGRIAAIYKSIITGGG